MVSEIKTCWDCSQRLGEECGINGKEVYPDTEACGSFTEGDDTDEI